MAIAKKKNPVMIMLWVVAILILAVIAIQIFWKQKTNPVTGEVGRVGVDDGGLSTAAKKSPVTKAPSAPVTTISDSDDPQTIPVE